MTAKTPLAIARAVWLALFFVLPSRAAELEWPQFRGPGSSGNNELAHPPSALNDKNRLWKTAVPRGHSSPIAAGNLVFLTCVENGRLQTLCVEAKTGKISWKQNAPVSDLEKVHEANSEASPTPVTDGENVYVYFGSYGVMAYNAAGNNIWKHPLPRPVSTWGTAASPILYKGNVLVVADSNDKKSELLALDCKTGAESWRIDRKDFGSGWSTPYIWRHGDAEELVVGSSGAVVSYEPGSGKELWRVAGLSRDPVSMPIGNDQLLFYVSPGIASGENQVPTWAQFAAKFDANKDGKVERSEIPEGEGIVLRPEIPVSTPGNLFKYSMIFDLLDKNKDGALDSQEWFGMIMFIASQSNSILAIKPNGTGLLTPEGIAWKAKKGLPELPSPLLYQNRIYLLRDGGMLTCYQASDGKLVFDRERIGADGQYCASPVAAAGLIYACSEQGVVTILKSGEHLEKISQLDFKEKIFATPALAGKAVYIRTETNLWAFGE